MNIVVAEVWIRCTQSIKYYVTRDVNNSMQVSKQRKQSILIDEMHGDMQGL